MFGSLLPPKVSICGRMDSYDEPLDNQRKNVLERSEKRKGTNVYNSLFYLRDLRAVYELNNDEREDARAAILADAAARDCRLPSDLAGFVAGLRAAARSEK